MPLLSNILMIGWFCMAKPSPPLLHRPDELITANLFEALCFWMVLPSARSFGGWFGYLTLNSISAVLALPSSGDSTREHLECYPIIISGDRSFFHFLLVKLDGSVISFPLVVCLGSTIPLIWDMLDFYGVPWASVL